MDSDRYARHHLLEGWDQSRLARARVLVAGVGAVGNEVVKLLALMGVEHLLLVDFDAVELSNLTRSVLFRESDVGRGKAEAASERARDLNPDVETRWLRGDLEFAVGLGVYRSMDVVIGCLDSLNARLALNRACQRAGVTWINTGIEAALGEVAVFAPGPGACFECGMSEALWASRNQRFSCGGLRADLPPDTVPTTAVLASLIAAFAVNEALRHIQGTQSPGEEETRRQGDKENTNHGPRATSHEPRATINSKLYLTVAPYALQTIELPRDPECLGHERWEPVTVIAERAGQITARDLLRRAGKQGGVVELGFDLLTHMRCLECGQEEAVFRPLETCAVALNRCPQCGADARQPQSVSWLDANSPFADRPLAELSVPEHQVLAVQDGGERQYFQISGDYGWEQGAGQ